MSNTLTNGLPIPGVQDGLHAIANLFPHPIVRISWASTGTPTLRQIDGLLVRRDAGRNAVVPVQHILRGTPTVALGFR